jgi:adenylate cyclase
VILGATAHSLGDYHATPYANGTLPAFWFGRPRLMSGPEVQANIAATLADGAFITTCRWPYTLLQVLVLGAILGWAFMRLTLLQGFLLAFLHHWAWKIIGVLAFWYSAMRIEMVAMLMTGVLCYGATFALRWRRLALRMRGMVRGEVLVNFLEQAKHSGLEGEERDVTVLFADIRGFTSYSRTHSPRVTVRMLNDYLEVVVPIVEAHGGMIEKYIGDGVMALFGAPIDRPDHAERAVRAAVAIVRRVHDLKTTWERKHYFPGFKIGLGINTGSALLGMIGSRNRLDYTAISDAVNVAARIESANKQCGSEILISAETRNAVNLDVLRELGCAEAPVQAEAPGILGGLIVYRIDVPDGPR